MQKTAKYLILISNIIWTILEFYNMNKYTEGESLGLIIGYFIIVILVLIMMWLPYIKYEASKKWAVAGLILSIIFFRLLSLVGYALHLFAIRKNNNR